MQTVIRILTLKIDLRFKIKHLYMGGIKSKYKIQCKNVIYGPNNKLKNNQFDEKGRL